jgi:hypothetical protein
MIPLIKRFFWDETAFIRWTRALLAGLGVAMHSGMIPIDALSGTKAWWLGPALIVLAFSMGAGEKNYTPEEIKGIAQDLTIVPTPPKNGK